MKGTCHITYFCRNPNIIKDMEAQWTIVCLCPLNDSF
jgi:hypothetical protein